MRESERSHKSLPNFDLNEARTELPLIKTGRQREEQVWGRRLGS